MVHVVMSELCRARAAACAHFAALPLVRSIASQAVQLALLIALRAKNAKASSVKNSRPFQLDPVMSFATSEGEWEQKGSPLVE